MRPKLSFANVMVVVLTFIVLGGGAYAATQLPRNSVGTAQLKNEAVTKKKLARGVLRNQYKPPIGVPGPAGPPGPKGEAATIGGIVPTGTTLRGVAFSSSSSNTGGTNATGTGISFGGAQLASRPVAHLVPPETTPPSECPGTYETPEAASGHLCIYMRTTVPTEEGQVIISDPTRASGFTNYNVGTKATTVSGDGTVARFGFRLVFTQNTLNSAQFFGSWAVTG